GRVLADGRVVLAGQAGVVLISEDGAHSFVRVDNDDRRTRAAVAQGEQPDALLLVGEEGVERLSLVPAAGGRS
ncbi:MAG TPA: sialidase, partial [Thauera sp.]|nr:sialidase [Thauera sp.]